LDDLLVDTRVKPKAHSTVELLAEKKVVLKEQERVEATAVKMVLMLVVSKAVMMVQLMVDMSVHELVD